MSGSPGAGKTLLSKCFMSILPPLEIEEAIELTKIYSISGLLQKDNPLITTLNWAVTIWDGKKFLERMATKGFGVWGDKMEFFDIEPLKATKVSYEQDFITCEKLLQIR